MNYFRVKEWICPVCGHRQEKKAKKCPECEIPLYAEEYVDFKSEETYEND